MYRKHLSSLIIFSVFSLVFISCKNKIKKVDKSSPKPNIVVIYTDDLGFGDISANGAKEIKTPNIDILANEGVRFTNGYASSATCTPSRYALLTGVYPWKNKRARILPGTAPLIIDTTQMTLPKMLKNKGYHTGIVGKWHLGLGTGNINWNETVSPGPNEVGFDYSYIMAATQDRVPTVYIENGDVVGLDPKDPIEIDYKNNFKGLTLLNFKRIHISRSLFYSFLILKLVNFKIFRIF
jgi:arylsulfatase A-like enzyme